MGIGHWAGHTNHLFALPPLRLAWLLYTFLILYYEPIGVPNEPSLATESVILLREIRCQLQFNGNIYN